MTDQGSADEILEFLRKNRFSKAEEALRNELNNRSDINGFLQKLKLEEKDSNEKAAGNELRRSGSRDSEVSKELIVKEVNCGTSTNGSVIKWENGAAAEKPSKKETFVSSEMSLTFSKNPADAAPPSDAHSYKFTSGNGTLEPYRNIDDNTSTSLVDSYALEQSMHVNLADIDKKIVETGEDIVFFGNKSTSWSGNTSKGNSRSKTKETSEIDRLVENFGKHDSYKGSIPSRTEDVVDTSENWKECSVKTLFQSSRVDASTSYNLLSSSDKREEKKKADISDVRAAIKEQESEVARTLFFGKSQSTFDDKNISSLGFPLVSDTRKEEFPSLPPVKLKSEENPLSLYCEEKFERNGSGPRIINDEEALLIGSYLDVPIGQEISSSGGKKSAGGNWLSVSQGIAVDASDLVSGFATIGDGLSESVDYRNEYWDSDEYEDDDNIGYVRQPIEDETWFLAHEIDYPSDHEKGTTRGSPDHHGRDGNKDEDDQSYVEEASYLSGEQYLQAKDAEPISSENDRRLTVSEIYPVSKKNDLVAQYDGQLIDEELLNSMRDEPDWQGFVAQSNELVMLGDNKGINVHRKSHLDDDCLEDYQHGSVRSIGVGISCDAADFGSEVRESLAGCSSEGNFEYSRDHDAVASRFKQLYSESNIKHIDGPNKNKQKESKNDGPDYIVDNDSGASFHVKIETDGGFSSGSSQKDGQLMHAESSKSSWSGNRETVTRDRNAERLSASTATDDMVATWRRQSSDSSSSRSSLKENNATSIKSMNSSPFTLSNYACEERKDDDKEDDRYDSSEREDDHGTALDDEEAVAVQEQKEEFETKLINGIIETEQFAMEQQNPKTQRQWRYTWEAQSHSPNLRLFLFDSTTNPKIHCKNLDVSIILEKSQLLVTWINDNEDEEATSKENRSEEFVSLCVPVPRVLLDTESSVNFKALDDHIEVRLVLLLPVDHPLVSDFNLVTDSREKSAPLVMDYDLKTLSLLGGVNFYCRNCSNMLTKKELFDFSEMPSINWRESADNWFGTCCCSFGGISEKIVVKYTNSYTCSSGLCLLSATTVLLSKDDLVECINSDKFGTENQIESSLALSCDLGRVEPGSRSSERNAESHENGGESACGRVDDSMLGCKDKASMSGCCVHDSHDSNESFQLEQQLTLDKNFLLDGFLEDVFMAKASNVSKNVEWIKFACPECSSPLGAYPSDVGSNDKPIDGGVRLFKCYISTSSAIGESSDVFRKYTLERMFTNQLLECAKEELSFHVLVKDLTTKSPLFQIVILNPNSWSSTGLCSSRDVLVSTLELSPIVKVLFSNCNSTVVKKIDEEVYLLKGQGEELIDLITNASKFLPSSYSYLQGSLVSSMHR